MVMSWCVFVCNDFCIKCPFKVLRLSNDKFGWLKFVYSSIYICNRIQVYSSKDNSFKEYHDYLPIIYIYIYIFMYVYIYIYVCMYVCNPKHSTSKIKIQLFCLLYVVMLKSSVVRFVQRVPNTGSSKVLQEATNRNSFKWSLVWCRPRSLRW